MRWSVKFSSTIIKRRFKGVKNEQRKGSNDEITTSKWRKFKQLFAFRHLGFPKIISTKILILLDERLHCYNHVVNNDKLKFLKIDKVFQRNSNRMVTKRFFSFKLLHAFSSFLFEFWTAIGCPTLRPLVPTPWTAFETKKTRRQEKLQPNMFTYEQQLKRAFHEMRKLSRFCLKSENRN